MKRVLLVVDDEAEIGRLIRRTLKSDFDEILLAEDSAEAEAFVKDGQITHLVVDLFLGPDEPLGTELVSRWRGILPGLVYAALFTGSSMEIQQSHDGVDAVFVKPMGLVELVDALRGRAASVAHDI